MTLLAQVIYVDTDTLWLDDATWWWMHFVHLRGQQAMFGLAEETNSGGSWYTNGSDLLPATTRYARSLTLACMQPVSVQSPCQESDRSTRIEMDRYYKDEQGDVPAQTNTSLSCHTFNGRSMSFLEPQSLQILTCMVSIRSWNGASERARELPYVTE